MAVGTLVRFDEIRGYGFIAPANGGEDVFVHANDFGEDRVLVRPGLRVRYEVAQTDRGLKAATAAIEDESAESAVVRAAEPILTDGECDVLSAADFRTAVTEALLADVPTLTGEQIRAVRKSMLTLAGKHGWVED